MTTNLVKAIKKSIKNLIGFFEYSIANKKNCYPYKIIGEQNAGIIIIKNLIDTKLYKIKIQDLLKDKNLINRLHPFEALKIGYITFEEIIKNIPPDKKMKKFNQIKEIMLNPEENAQFILPKKPTKNTQRNNPFNTSNEIDSHINKYPFTLAGFKKTKKIKKTTIIYTILGKREGYDITLEELISKKELLEKFHPTEAIKFGFIHLGDISLNSTNKEEKT